ncbi:MAG: hypothetical protein AAGA29_10480 [Planctomycetota bacterium]
MKKLIKVLVVLVVLVLIAAVAGFVYMDSIATAGVKKAMAYATQCDVEVGKVDVKPMSGAVTITDLDIKNPEAFREIHDSFLVLGSGDANVSFTSLRTDLVEVPEVKGDGIVISLIGREGKTNYQTVLDSLNRLQGDAEEPAEPEGGKSFVIRNTELTPIKVIVDMDEDPVLGLAPVQLELELKPITLTDIGEGGVPLSQISADLIADILVQVVAQLGTQLGDRVLSGLTSGLSGILGPDALQGRLSDITSSLGLESIDVGAQLGKAAELGTAVFEGAGEVVGDVVGGAGDAIGGAVDGAGDLVDGILGGGGDEGEGEEDGGGALDGVRGLIGGDDE